jgi:hypothetical protein
MAVSTSGKEDPCPHFTVNGQGTYLSTVARIFSTDLEGTSMIYSTGS